MCICWDKSVRFSCASNFAFLILFSVKLPSSIPIPYSSGLYNCIPARQRLWTWHGNKLAFMILGQLIPFPDFSTISNFSVVVPIIARKSLKPNNNGLWDGIFELIGQMFWNLNSFANALVVYCYCFSYSISINQLHHQQNVMGNISLVKIWQILHKLFLIDNFFIKFKDRDRSINYYRHIMPPQSLTLTRATCSCGIAATFWLTNGKGRNGLSD